MKIWSLIKIKIVYVPRRRNLYRYWQTVEDCRYTTIQRPSSASSSSLFSKFHNFSFFCTIFYLSPCLPPHFLLFSSSDLTFYHLSLTFLLSCSSSSYITFVLLLLLYLLTDLQPHSKLRHKYTTQLWNSIPPKSKFLLKNLK